MKTLIEQNYQSIIKRGLITDKTTVQEFVDKIYEEVNELEEAETEKELVFEMADVILTVLNYARHFNYPIEKTLKQKIEINKNR